MKVCSVVPMLIVLLLTMCKLGLAQELGSQITAQLAQCGRACDVRLPPVQQSKWTTPISVPCTTDGVITLSGSGPSTVLTFTGSGPAIDVNCPSNNNGSVNIKISNFKLVLASPGENGPTSGIHLATFNGGTISDVVIENSPENPKSAADGIFIEGANSITINNVRISRLRNGIHNVGILLNGLRFSANAIHVFGGEIAENSGCGVFEDGANASKAGPNLGNSYMGITFEGNGSIGDAATGNACIEMGLGISFIGNYFENFRSVPYQAWIGDSRNRAQGILFSGNTFVSTTGTQATLNLADSDGATIIGNIEVAAIPSFIHNSARSSRTFLYPNMFLAAHNAGNKAPRISGVSGSTIGIVKMSYVAQ
jgi:hypothetical protein